MAFRIRKIEYTADGRRLVRDTDLATEQLTIGRAPDNAIALPDLAVEPVHAELTPAGLGKLSLRALGTLGVTVDGRSLSNATIDIASGAELGFGTYRLGLSRDGDGAVLITVEDATAERDKVDATQDKQGFSLATVMPGKRPLSWVLALVILLAFLAVPIATHLRSAAHPDAKAGRVVNDAAWNPGALSLAHHSLTDRCETCHVRPFESVRNTTCLSCHKDTHDHAPAARLASARGSAGVGLALRQTVAHAFGREGPGACVDCHVEHTGNRPMESPRQQFCADCHAGLTGRLPDTKLGNAADFGTNHPQFRAAIITNAESRKPQLISLDAHPREDNGLTFSHKIHLDPRGGVAKMAMTLGGQGYGQALDCANCHQRSADGVNFKPITMEANCEACHSLAYGRVGSTVLHLRHGDVAQANADLSRANGVEPLATARLPGLYRANFTPKPAPNLAQKAFTPDGLCGQCHAPIRRNGQLGLRHVTSVTRYMPNGWFDHNAHRQTPCGDCHLAKQSQSASDVLLPKVKQCRDCHLGENATAPKVPSGCAMCHAYHVSALPPPADHKPRHHDKIAATDAVALGIIQRAAAVAGDNNAHRSDH
jgi:pSer/pThr/pTyr-binding forkhead associated (FHA) protein